MQTITQLLEEYRAGNLTPETVIDESLRVINEKNGEINAFLDVYDDARQVAAAATERYKNDKGILPPLLGVPLALKNNILMEGKRATGASKILEHYTATYDATVVRRLKDAGAIIVGATNLDEFAMGSSTENSAFGVTKNPLDLRRVPGGSSGGSAAAVAMGAVPGAIGTDTGGSIRQPASYCGLVGFKPTYGAVSRYGLMPMGSSLDQAGPLTTTVRDAALLHRVMAGLDPMDATTIDHDTYETRPKKDQYVFGIPAGFVNEGVDADVVTVFEAHVAELKRQGHVVREIPLPLFEEGLAAYYIVVQAEISSNLARYDGIRYGLHEEGETLLSVYEKTRAAGFGKEVKRRILLGTYLLSSGYYDAYYGKAEQVRRLMRKELMVAFSDVDIILTPTAPTPAFLLGEQSDPMAMYAQDIFTVPVNLTGVPALTFPMGSVVRDNVSLPVGVQYIAPHGADDLLLALGENVYDNQA